MPYTCIIHAWLYIVPVYQYEGYEFKESATKSLILSILASN